jgi:hypothetical protein
MSITTRQITAVSGLCAAAAGALFIAVQVNHPHLDATSIQTTEMAIRGTGKVFMAVLALAGLTGMYASQVRRIGRLGLVGYVVMTVGYLCIMGTAYASAFILPSVAVTDPAAVDDFINVGRGDAVVGDIGLFAVVQKVQDFGFLAGGLLFGIALYRARVLARWASLLLAVGGLVTVAVSLMPDPFYRLLAFPNGIAMLGLGVSLWLTQRHVPAEGTSTSHPEVVTAH